jgi:hypothetical protein
MTRSPGTAKQTRTEQREHTRQTAQTALGKLLLLNAGIAKNADDKPIEVKLDAEIKVVIDGVIRDVRAVLTYLSEAKPSQAKAEAKPKQTKKPSRSATTRATGVYNRHNQEWSKQ